jgi:putative membrane protein
MMLVLGWAIFLVSLAKSVEVGENSKILAVLSMFFMLAVLVVGTKLMLAFPHIAKSGMWIHVKLSLDILAMLLNAYLFYVCFKNKSLSGKMSKYIYWITVLLFFGMYYMTLYRPF